MTGILASLFLSLGILLIQPVNGPILDDHLVSYLYLIVGSLFFPIVIILNTMTFLNLQHSIDRLSASIIDVFKEDRRIRYYNALFLIFPLISYVFSSLSLVAEHPFLNGERRFVLWLLLLGLEIDLIRAFIRTIGIYLNPLDTTQQFLLRAKNFSKKGDDRELLNTMDSLGEISIKALEQHSESLAMNALYKLYECLQSYFLSSRLWSSSPSKNKESEHILQERWNFVLVYFCKKLELIQQRAVLQHFESVCNEIISLLGKSILLVARYDAVLSRLPVHFLGKCEEMCRDAKMDDMIIRSSCTLQEIVKTLVNEEEYSSKEVGELILSLLKRLEEMAKAIFRKDKSINLNLIRDPFKEIIQVLKEEKTFPLPFRNEVTLELERILGEFAALELVMRKITASSSSKGNEDHSLSPSQEG